MNRLIDSVKKYFKKPDVVTSNWTFWFHSVVTTSALVVFSTILALRELVGEPIRCIPSGISGKFAYDSQFVNRFCWMSTTFAVPDAFKHHTAESIPGVVNEGEEEFALTARKHYVYYQWVVLVMSFQALLCYLPKKFWKGWEGGLMKCLVMEHPGWKASLCKCTDEKKAKRKTDQVNYIVKHLNAHNWYAFCHWFAELMCFINVIVQMYMMNLFFKGDFIKYGWNVMTFSEMDSADRVDSMAFVFPKTTKCTYRGFGPSGSIQKFDALCILPLNVVNEKTYIFLWFWFIILAVATGIVVVTRIVLALFPKYRRTLVCFADPVLQKTLTERLSIGDWWVLYMLGKNLDPQYFVEVLSEVAHEKRSVDNLSLKFGQLV